MTAYTTMVDGDRVRAAENAYAGLQLAVRDAETALAKARDDAKVANREAQAAADRGDDAAQLDAAELAVDNANRAVRVAERVLEAAKRRLVDGEQTRAHEIKQSHGGAMNAAMTRLLAIREEALAAFAKLEELKDEHRDVSGQMVSMASIAKSGLPNYVTIAHRLLDDNGKLMDQREFDNRLNQLAHHEWDREAGKLRWVED